MVRRILIIGASRGIGLGLVDRHLELGWEVHATTRDGSAPLEHADVTGHRLDVLDREQVRDLVATFEVPFDRIIHNAGINRGTRDEIMAVNADAPIRVLQSLLDAKRLGAGGTIGIMTSQMGARRGRGGSLGDYGDSKAALNDEFRRLAPAWRESGAIAVVIHPGWVRTDMGGAGAPLTIEESARGIVEVMDGLTASHHGRFLTWDGREHPW